MQNTAHGTRLGSNLELGRVGARTIDHIYDAADTKLLPRVSEIPAYLQEFRIRFSSTGTCHLEA
jgi:hypothetical protein